MPFEGGQIRPDALATNKTTLRCLTKRSCIDQCRSAARRA
jgi:hypothetical protein